MRTQDQRTPNAFSCKDVHQEVNAPTGHAMLHDVAIFAMTATRTVALHSMVLLLAAAAEPAYTVPEQPWAMPFTIQGGAFPTTLYSKPEPTADSATTMDGRSTSAQPSAQNRSMSGFGIEPDAVVLEYLYRTRRGKEQWRQIGEFERIRYPGNPSVVRLGKMNHAGRNADFPSPGAAGTCRASGLRVWGSVDSH